MFSKEFPLKKGKSMLKQDQRLTMRFQTAPAQGLGLQQSRQQPPHLARVAGKHRALKPEQATSSQQFDFFLSHYPRKYFGTMKFTQV